MRNVYLIARRDYLGYISSWGFWLGMLLTPVIIAASMVVPTLLRENQPVRYYAVVEDGEAFTRALEADLEDQRRFAVTRQFQQLALNPPEGFDPQSATRFADALKAGADIETAVAEARPGVAVSVPERDFVLVPAPAREVEALAPYLRGETRLPGGAGDEDRRLFAVLLVDPQTGAVTYVSEDVVNNELKLASRRASRDVVRARILNAAGLDPDTVEAEVMAAPPLREIRTRAGGTTGEVTMADQAPFIAAMLIGFVLWFLIFSVVNYLITGTIEERSNKIFDTLLTSVKLSHLLTGKLVAVLALAMTLMGTWALGGFILASLVGGGLPADAGQFLVAVGGVLTKPSIILPTLASFVLGYLIYGAVFLAIGSLCDSLQEAQTLLSPVLIVLMIPLFLLTLAITDPKSSILAAASWIPLFTPFLLILRLPTSLPAWEVISLIGLMAVTATIVLWLAGKVYRAGAVHGAGVPNLFKGLKRRGRSGRPA